MKKRMLFIFPAIILLSSALPYSGKKELALSMTKESSDKKYLFTSDILEKNIKLTAFSTESLRYYEQRKNAEEVGFKSIPRVYRKFAEKVCSEYNIPYDIQFKIIFSESGWKSRMISGPNRNGTTDHGLGGINSDYVDYYEERFYDKEFLKGFYNGPFDVMNPYVNLQLSFSYLRFLIDHFDGDLNKAVMSYNAGLNRIKRNDIPSRTVAYSKYILGEI